MKFAAAKQPEGLHNGTGDAWRHSNWSAAMTDVFDTKTAKSVGDAHERQGINGGSPMGETNMDLFNNYQGRTAKGALPGSGYSPDDISDGLLKEGYLQKQPFLEDPNLK